MHHTEFLTRAALGLLLLLFFTSGLLLSLASILGGGEVLGQSHALLFTALGFLLTGLYARKWMLKRIELAFILCLVLMAVTIVIRAFFAPEFIVLPGADNAQSLAANVVVLAISFLSIRRYILTILVEVWFHLFIICILLLTGSRMALVAYIVNWIFFGLRSEHARLGRKQFDDSYQVACKRARVRNVVIMVVLVVLLALVAIASMQRVNLLAYSNNFSKPVWYKGYAKQLEVRTGATLGPDKKTTASFLEAERDPESPYTDLILFQTAALSQKHQPYVASLYLKADTPQQVVLTNNLGTRVLCEVDLDWKRCVTPVAIGDGSTYVKLNLLTAREAATFRVFAWGAQVEAGTTATRVQLTEANIFSDVLYQLSLLRLNPVLLATDLSVRREIFEKTWSIFLDQPLAGLGWGKLSEKFAALDFATPVAPSHAHNLVLQLLVETGLLGLVAWLLVVAGSYILLSYYCGNINTLRPLGLVVIMLNLLDITYFTNLAYYGFWLTTGLAFAKKYHYPGSF
jgi:hypothetical protein